MTYDLNNPLYKIAQLISDTNNPGQWQRSGRYEKERRINEAGAILDYLGIKSVITSTSEL